MVFIERVHCYIILKAAGRTVAVAPRVTEKGVWYESLCFLLAHRFPTIE